MNITLEFKRIVFPEVDFMYFFNLNTNSGFPNSRGLDSRFRGNDGTGIYVKEVLYALHEGDN